MQKSHDTIARRLALILTKFNEAQKFTASELAQEFGVSLRTIQRDLNSRLSYLPIKKESDYYSLETYALGKLTLEDIKSFATMSGIKELYPALTDSFIIDILNNKINATYLVKNHGFEALEHKTKEFELLSVAILHHQHVQFNYNEKARDTKPYKLVNNQGIWYLVADEKQELKTYSFSKISHLKIIDKNFKPNEEFINTIKKNEANWFSQTVLEITLEIDKSVAEYFLRRKILPNQTILEHNDKKLVLSTKVSYENEILSIVQYWLPHIKIISPTHLEEKLHDVLQKYIKN
ncbi:MAG: WYL domain-containing protein [Campylobacterales bacterium]|nr:WYL domain-containing protein [Campylobacterales bacterium]